MLCGASKNAQNLKKVDLQNVRFEDIYLYIKSSTLKFDTRDGNFKQTSNNQSTFRRNPNDDFVKLVDEERFLQSEIKRKNDRMKVLVNKIGELDEKIEQMRKILEIDVNEKNYINSIKERYMEENK